MALLDDVRAVCRRLAPHGWADLLAAHGLQLDADDLAGELGRRLPSVDRDLPGFEDFSLDGVRGVEPGSPAGSLLYHALASPGVTLAPDGSPLGDFATPAELEAVENYVFGVRAPSMPEIVVRAGAAPLAVVVFATEYRPSTQTPHQRHADLVFSRTGVARVGTAPASYDGRQRGYLPFVAEDAHALRVLPARYAPYLAVRVAGDPASALPMRFRRATATDRGDGARQFWVPLHKLFDGRECLRGRDLTVRWQARHVNEKLRRIHLALGARASWGRPHIDRPPFRFTNGIAELSGEPDMGTGTLVPVPHRRLVVPAELDGRPLTFEVPPDAPLLSSSLNIPPEGDWRHGPEFVHVRHRVDDDGSRTDLNERADVTAVVAAGGYRAQHYLDFTGDGFVAAVVPQLASDVPRRRSAYSIVAAPDFFPSTDQRELTEWTASRVPSRLRASIWQRPPDALSDDRLPPNITVRGSGFRADDDTVTALVSLPSGAAARPTRLEDVRTERHSHLPDDAAGFFAPGWDISVDGRPGGPMHLAAYGLGSPFPEDSKLCAAISAFWPAVAPDAARTFEPKPDWPTVAPLTDAEVGSAGQLPWDGVPGPRLVRLDGQELVEYASFDHADYVTNSLLGTFTLALTGRVTEQEYRSRVLAMARAYDAVGVGTGASPGAVLAAKGRWAVVSFRTTDGDDPDVRSAVADTGALLVQPLYRFELCRRGPVRPSATDVAKVHMPVQRRVSLLVDPVSVLLLESGGRWRAAP